MSELKRELSPRRILILGGGFAGVYTALELQKRLARDEDIEVMLVNRENFFLFTPMLHEVAASDLDLTAIVSPIRKLLRRRVQFFEGEVAGVDLLRRRATLVHGSTRHSHEVPFDHLVVALGSVTNFYNLPGVAERAVTMKTLGDAIHLRNRLIGLLEEADTECAASQRRPLMTVVVVGGGFAGVETIGAVNDFVRESLRFYRNIDGSLVRMILVHPGEVILPELGEELGRYSQQKLAAAGVEIRTGTKVTAIGDAGVELSDGTLIPAATVVWTAGTSPHPLIPTLPCAKIGARIKVNERLEVDGYDNVWALGDAAAVPDLRNPGKFHPPTAQHAIREAKVVARNIIAAMRHGTPEAFHFRTLGQLAAIGRRAGVAKVFGLKFSGVFAWFLWRTIYLSKLPRFEKKVRVALDWTLDLFFAKDLVQYLTDRAQTMSEAPPAHESPHETTMLHV